MKFNIIHPLLYERDSQCLRNTTPQHGIPQGVWPTVTH